MERLFTYNFFSLSSISEALRAIHCLRFNGTNYSHRAPLAEQSEIFDAFIAQLNHDCYFGMPPLPFIFQFIHHSSLYLRVSMRVELKCHHLIDDVSFTSQSPDMRNVENALIAMSQNSFSHTSSDCS